MRGTVLGFDPTNGTGVILDADGSRVSFARHDWLSPGEPRPGSVIDFTPVESRATEIFLFPGGAVGGGADDERKAMTFGILSLVCAIMIFIPYIGLFALIASVVFGIIGRNVGRDLPDKMGYYLSIAGLVISGIWLVIIITVIVACTSFVGSGGRWPY